MSIDERGGKANCEHCGAEFERNPQKKDHRFCGPKCRAAGWHFKTAGSKILAKLQKEMMDLESRVAKLESKTK